MNIERNWHLERLIARKHNNMIKIITGMRRSGKSYLLFNLFYEYLKKQGVDDRHIIRINLEDRRNASLRNPDNLLSYIDSLFVDDAMHYILLDEVQMVSEFEDVLNSYLHIANADVYVTGSNARFLSKDIITEFRGRGDVIKITPLTFKEFMTVHSGTKEQGLMDYMTYGGLPQVALMDNHKQKREFLRALFTSTYIRDIRDRYHVKKEQELGELIDIMASNIGGLTNPTKLANTFKSVKHSDVSPLTVSNFLEMLQDSFLIDKAIRYDIKGKRYIDTPAKYYFEDLGLRNARINFRQIEFPHLMENLIFNELVHRGFSVDVGQVSVTETTSEGKRKRSLLEVDFVCNEGYNRYYIQSAYALPTLEKQQQEYRSLLKINDGFKKIVIVGDSFQPTYQTDSGILIMNIYNFLMNEYSIN